MKKERDASAERLTHERNRGSPEIDTAELRPAREYMNVLPHGGGLRAVTQVASDTLPHDIERDEAACNTPGYVNHMEPVSGLDEARQHADVRVPEDLGIELRHHLSAAELTERSALCAGRTVGAQPLQKWQKIWLPDME